ncbi:isochorismatase [Streptomyces eurocidicus]|uniref:Isochorismatase n=1 Tax=Streptomyces eurocidicus TaxID=66423 RepID=A0A2N8P2I4_STREU|nr:isochorismatase family protein [Streptomyces eurocidicus]MBB5117351.1 nicotinamidase-related amidase [Streptomyces eurocidicus]MBF6056576.1 isochorismatase family protein [Streptomyces eurocidicus]PNE35219.1 isochorismatase [Streptomyces eurocidicus]
MTEIDPRRTALVLIDLMERVVALPLAPYGGDEVVRTAGELARSFRAAGAPVVVVRVERPGPAEQPPGSGLLAGVSEPGDIEVVKRTVGAFHGTDLDARLRERGVRTLVLGGVATNLGVESTARAAADHGYELVFVEDAMSALTEDEHRASVTLDMPRLGTVVKADAVRVV